MAGKIEQIGGKLEMSKTVSANFALITKNENLKLRGHYIVRWKWKVTGPNSNFFAFGGISGSKLTVGEPSNGTFFNSGPLGQSMFFMQPLLGSAQAGHVDIVHFYRNIAGNIVNAKFSISGSAWPQGLEVTDELEYDGTKIFFRSDVSGVTGFTPLQRNTEVVIDGTVKDFTSHILMIGVPHTNVGAGMKILADDIEVITVPPPP